MCALQNKEGVADRDDWQTKERLVSLEAGLDVDGDSDGGWLAAYCSAVCIVLAVTPVACIW